MCTLLAGSHQALSTQASRYPLTGNPPADGSVLISSDQRICQSTSICRRLLIKRMLLLKCTPLLYHLAGQALLVRLKPSLDRSRQIPAPSSYMVAMPASTIQPRASTALARLQSGKQAQLHGAGPLRASRAWCPQSKLSGLMPQCTGGTACLTSPQGPC